MEGKQRAKEGDQRGRLMDGEGKQREREGERCWNICMVQNKSEHLLPVTYC